MLSQLRIGTLAAIEGTPPRRTLTRSILTRSIPCWAEIAGLPFRRNCVAKLRRVWHPELSDGPRRAMNQVQQPSPADNFRFARFGWRLPPVLEGQFRRETAASRKRLIRGWHGIGAAVNGIAFLVALWSVPELWQLNVLIYFGIVMPSLLVCHRVLAGSLWRWQERLASFLPLLLSILAMLTMFALSPAHDFEHSISLLAMGIVWSGAPIPLQVPDAIIFVALALLLGGGINVVGFVLHDAPFEHPQLVIFGLVMIALALVSRVESERRSRDTFVRGLLLSRHAAELERAKEQLEIRSNTDALTRVFNRHFLQSRLPALWAERTLNRAPVAALMIDIDHFKFINDTYGHPQGDRCLVAVAQEITRNVRHDDVVARYGGEEFLVLMADNESEAHAAAERIRLRISECAIPGFDPSKQQSVTVSIGVAAMDPTAPDATPVALIDAADAALLSAKRTGRNRVVVAGEPAKERADTLGRSA